MEQNYIFANIRKRERLDPFDFGPDARLAHFITRKTGPQTALCLLLGPAAPHGVSPIEQQVLGRWAGDPVVVAGDDMEEGRWTETGHENLYAEAQRRFRNIGPAVVEAMTALTEGAYPWRQAATGDDTGQWNDWLTTDKPTHPQRRAWLTGPVVAVNDRKRESVAPEDFGAENHPLNLLRTGNRFVQALTLLLSDGALADERRNGAARGTPRRRWIERWAGEPVRLVHPAAAADYHRAGPTVAEEVADFLRRNQPAED